MKVFIGSMMVMLGICFNTVVFADNVIVTETTGWQSVPVTVDTTKHTYTVVGTEPTAMTNFYYSYSGYRCFKVQRTNVTVNPITFTATTGGATIYCYPEQ